MNPPSAPVFTGWTMDSSDSDNWPTKQSLNTGYTDLLPSVHTDCDMHLTIQILLVMHLVGPCTELHHSTLTLFCKEGEETARDWEPFVVSCQTQNKVQQKKNRAVLRTWHISCNQTQTPRLWGSRGVRGDHCDPSLHCVMTRASSEGKHAPRKAGSQIMV